MSHVGGVVLVGEESSRRRRRTPPPWEVVALLAHRLDPKTLATAACVSKTWHLATSSDDVWKPHSTSHYPSFTATLAPSFNLPHRQIFALARSAAASRLHNPLPKPSLSLAHLAFALELCTPRGARDSVRVAGPAEELGAVDPAGVFRFDFVGLSGVEVEVGDEVGVRWHVVMREGWKAAFTVVDSVVKVRREEENMNMVGLFSEELPRPGCCCGDGGSSRMVADVKMGLGGGARGRVEKVSLGLLSTVSWRYVSLEDGLRYLQHFLLDARN